MASEEPCEFLSHFCFLHTFIFYFDRPVPSTKVKSADTSNPTNSDIHVYYFQANPEQTKFAKELWERIRRECKFF